ncbi:MAG: hypothetical protein IPK60_08425 [Sandaracinaceae bacterium]|nr:hypothetical protein [Sandaracinaceae bacterium]
MNEPGLAFQRLLDLYEGVLSIRSRESFRIVSARRIADGSPCVVLLPGTNAKLDQVQRAFEEIVLASSLFTHPRVPRVRHHGCIDGTPFVELDCDAVTDGFEIVKLMADADAKIPYDSADAFISSIREAIGEANAAVDPRSNGPLCLGRLSLANVLFNARGEWFVVGFGRNFPVEREDGSVDPAVACCYAPELASGGAPSPSADYVAVLLFMRSVMPYADMTGAVGRILRGELQPEDAELLQCLLWVETRMVGELAQRRAPIAEAVAMAERIRELAGTRRDEAGFSTYVRGLLERAEEEPRRIDQMAPPESQTLTLARDALWVKGSDGTRHRLGRAHRRILLALIDRHREAPDTPLTVWDLLNAGWPGEKPQLEAGANRVYVAVASIRQIGLRDLIERFDDGYRLATRARVAFADQ